MLLQFRKKAFMLKPMYTDALEFEGAARAKGLTISEICKRAGKARSIFDRWKSGETAPTLTTLKAFNRVLEAEENG